MTRTFRWSSKAVTDSHSVKTSLQDVVIFPDGSVAWEEPEVVEPPLPYAGYELLPVNHHPTSIAPRSQAIVKGTRLEPNRTRWMMVGGAIALLTAGLGVTLTRRMLRWVSRSEISIDFPETSTASSCRIPEKIPRVRVAL